MRPNPVRDSTDGRLLPGVTIAMGGHDWLVPPLTLGQLRRLMPKLQKLTAVGARMGETQIGVVCEIVATALQRNYPKITEEQVADLVDLGNAGDVMNAILTGSGLRPTAEGEALAARNSAGAVSTDFSPPLSDGAIPL